MLHVGLTGNIASGKSTVAGMLRERGAAVVDSDELARQAVEPGSAGLRSIGLRFGNAVLQSDGALDRKALGRIVFNDPIARRDLNAIVHPEVGRLRELELAKSRAAGVTIVVSDIPLLFEVRLEGEFDAVILVDAPEHVRLERLMVRRGLSEADARAMMGSQWPSADKRPLATFVIDNDASIEALEKQVDLVWARLREMAGQM